MLYYIIPPIIIVISTSVLIYFLFRKAEQMPVQNIIDQDLEKSDDSNVEKVKDAIIHGWLKILERIMHRAKLMSLKFHNISNERFHAIRKKRQEIIEQEKEEKEEKDAALEVIKEEKPPVKIENQKPLIRQDIVRPDVRRAPMVAKNQLEDALIKRIAVNPRDIEAYERLGDYYLETSNQKDALECFRQVLRLNPTHHKAKLRIRRIEKVLQEK